MQTINGFVGHLILHGMQLPADSLIPAAAEGDDRDVPTEQNGQIVVMKESQLERLVGVHENANELALWVEYRHEGRQVHRSAHVHLKKASMPMVGELASVT